MAGTAERVLTLCDDALARLPAGDGRDLVTAVREKLVAPLQVCIAGGVSSGKSTLVNALLGQQIAAVDAGECTRVVTWFRWDPHERAEVQLVTGERYHVQLDRGRLPASLGAPPEAVRRVVVNLSNAALTDLTLVDTPGLNTVTEVHEADTAAFLGVGATKEATDTAVAIGQADALVFLMPHLREADATVLRGFRDLYSGTGLSAVNAVGVLSRIDRLARDGDPLTVAEPIAQRVNHDLRGLVSRVVPVIGLLAETARAALFTEDDFRAVARLATVEDALDREDMLISAEDFLSFDGVDLDVGMRRRLLGLLDLYGLQVAIAAVDAGARGAGAVLRALEQRSGFAEVADLVLGRFGRQADLLKTHVAMCDLDRISYMRTDADAGRVLRSLRTPLEHLALDADVHDLHVLEAMQAAATGALALPDDLLDDLDRLVAGEDPCTRLGTDTAGAPAEALARATAWGSWGGDPRRSPLEARHARRVKEAYELLWTRVSA
ncbi:MAG: dynamin family protein [Acidimicrobiia bacterium]